MSYADLYLTQSPLIISPDNHSKPVASIFGVPFDSTHSYKPGCRFGPDVIRDAEKEWIQYILVIGERESNSANLSIREGNTDDVKELPFDEFIKEIHSQTKDKPYSSLNLPLLLSKRPIIQV